MYKIIIVFSLTFLCSINSWSVPAAPPFAVLDVTAKVISKTIGRTWVTLEMKVENCSLSDIGDGQNYSNIDDIMKIGDTIIIGVQKHFRADEWDWAEVWVDEYWSSYYLEVNERVYFPGVMVHGSTTTPRFSCYDSNVYGKNPQKINDYKPVVFPNPHKGNNGFIYFANLPLVASISIFDISGTLVRKYNEYEHELTDPFQDNYGYWDLNNQSVSLSPVEYMFI